MWHMPCQKEKKKINNASKWLWGLLKNFLIRPIIQFMIPTLQTICTFTATLNLPTAEQGIVDEVWQAAVEVNWGQAALEALPGDHELGEVLVHVGSQTPHKQVT